MTVFQHIATGKFLRFFVLALAFALIFKACNPDFTSEIGSGLQPDNEFIGAYFNNTHESLRLIAYTIPDLPGMTSARNFFALGSFNDPTFGTVSIDLITQIDQMSRGPSDTVGTIFAIDSVVMILVYANAYPFQEGYELDPFYISIGELTQPMPIDRYSPARSYFSNDSRDQIGGGGTIVSNLEVRPNLRDSIILRVDTIMNADTITRFDTVRSRVPTLRIPIYGAAGSLSNNFGGQEFGHRLLHTSASLDTNTTAQFVNRINGIYIETHPEQNSGRGNVVNFDFTGNIVTPHIRVYYRQSFADTASSVKLYAVGFWSAMTYNYVRFDRSMASPDFTSQLAGDRTSGENMVFMQSFFGSLVRVEMPDIRRFREITGDTMHMVINHASLVLNPVVQSSNGERHFMPIPALNVGILSDTTINDTIMQIDRSFWMNQQLRDHGVTIGGNLDNRRGEYRIVLTRHIQNLLLLDEESSAEANQPLTIFPANRLLFPDFSAIHGPGLPLDDNRRMRLEIVYSLIPK